MNSHQPCPSGLAMPKRSTWMDFAPYHRTLPPITALDPTQHHVATGSVCRIVQDGAKLCRQRPVCLVKGTLPDGDYELQWVVTDINKMVVPTWLHIAQHKCSFGQNIFMAWKTLWNGILTCKNTLLGREVHGNLIGLNDIVYIISSHNYHHHSCHKSSLKLFIELMMWLIITSCQDNVECDLLHALHVVL